MKKAFSISPIRYATVANYSPRGISKLSVESRNTCYKFKNGNPVAISNFARYVHKLLDTSDQFKDFFGPDVVLVPVPSSSLLVAGGLWPSLLIAQELAKVGLAKEVATYLKRTKAILKSSTAPPGQRPTIEDQYNSLSINLSQDTLTVFVPERITLIDDVLTKGRTSFACALRLADIFPDSTISIFAPMRTQGLILDIEKYIEPDVGYITYNENEDVSRSP